MMKEHFTIFVIAAVCLVAFAGAFAAVDDSHDSDAASTVTYSLTITTYGGGTAYIEDVTKGTTSSVGSAGQTVSLSVNSGDTLKLHATPSTGYKFAGWENIQTSQIYSTSNPLTITAGSSNYTFGVDFEKKASTSYTSTLAYNANGGSGAPSSQTYTGTSTSSHTFTVSSTTPTRSGYEFLGWATSSSATTASYTAGSSISVSYNGTKTLYAVWQEKVTNYTVTVYKGNWDSFKVIGLDSSKVTSSSKSYTVAKGTSIDVDWYGKSSTSGSGADYTYTTTYSSSCYNMASSLYGTSLGDSVTVNSSGKYYPASEMTSTTTYTYQYSITFNANGGSGAPSTVSTTGSSTSKTIALPSTVPTRSGYTFLGWSTSSTASSASYAAGSSYSFGYGTTALYAVWKQSAITVTGTPDAYGVVGSAWSFSPTVSVSGCTVTISGAPWMMSSGTTVSGTPTSPGTYDVTLTFSKSGYDSAIKTFSVTVLSALTFDSSPTGGAIIYAI